MKKKIISIVLMCVGVLLCASDCTNRELFLIKSIVGIIMVYAGAWPWIKKSVQ